MTLEELIRVLDGAEANLNKLDAVWREASPLIPREMGYGTTREYETCRRRWRTLAGALPPIDGWQVVADLPDLDEMGRAFFQYHEAGEPPLPLWHEGNKPGLDLDEYRYRLEVARSRAIRQRTDQLVQRIDGLLPIIIRGVPRDSGRLLRGDECAEVKDAVAEIERLVGSSITRQGRWSDLSRHLSFGQGHDWHDVIERDWPDVRSQLTQMTVTEWEPVHTAKVDIGEASREEPSGGVAVGLDWSVITDNDFERVLYNLLNGLENYQNVDWLMKTNAPDRSRDLSAERVFRDGSGETRVERVIVQAKHWQSKSISAPDLTTCLASISLWEPPSVHCVIMATSGHFTADVIKLIEDRNNNNEQPRIEMWPQGRIEALLAQQPGIIAEFGLSR